MTIIGIDLGTTNSCAAIWRDGKPEIILNSDGLSLTPSVVAFDGLKQEWIVGQKAKELAKYNPLASVYSIKRFIGRRYSDEIVQKALHKLRILYKLEESAKKINALNVVLGDFHLTPPEVSAKILQKIKRDAEIYLDHSVTDAIITVPAYFHDSQRQATRDAGRIAGLNVRRVLNEPTAACLAFGYSKLRDERKTVAVYDLGGGTFDVSILEVGGQRLFRVHSTNGHTDLGGDDLDWMIVDWFLGQLDKTDQEKFKDDLVVIAHLRALAEEAKIALSNVKEFRLTLSDEIIPIPGLKDLEFHLPRTKLEELAVDWISKTFEPCKQALADARLKTSDIKEVLLVGGQTRMPAIREAVRVFFGQEPNTQLNPDEVVGLGAAVDAAILSGQATGLKLSDVIPLTLGVNTRGRMDCVLRRNTPIPVVESKIYTTTEDNQESVEIQIYQGEHLLTENNIKLASFVLVGIEPAQAQKPEIKITFEVDEDGILHVTGKDLQTGNYQEITITDSIRLSEDEIHTMIQDTFESADKYDLERKQAKLMEKIEIFTSQLQKLLSEGREGLVVSVAEIESVLSSSRSSNLEKQATDLENLFLKIQRR